MIDWHSHVLPAMDDGSRNVEESHTMLQRLKDQGVTHVLATPHFYANDESVEEFLSRRNAAYERLVRDLHTFDLPQIICGAEVRYYPGISQMKDLDLLTLVGTKVILLEMPVSTWTEYTVKELLDLVSVRRLTVVIAHVERYIALQSKEVLKTLSENGLLMQSNTGFFKGFFSRQKALNLLRSGMVQMIGTDCHNLTTRPPDLEPAYLFIKKKIGNDFIRQMNELGHRLLGIHTESASVKEIVK